MIIEIDDLLALPVLVRVARDNEVCLKRAVTSGPRRLEDNSRSQPVFSRALSDEIGSLACTWLGLIQLHDQPACAGYLTAPYQFIAAFL